MNNDENNSTIDDITNLLADGVEETDYNGSYGEEDTSHHRDGNKVKLDSEFSTTTTDDFKATTKERQKPTYDSPVEHNANLESDFKEYEGTFNKAMQLYNQKLEDGSFQYGEQEAMQQQLQGAAHVLQNMDLELRSNRLELQEQNAKFKAEAAALMPDVFGKDEKVVKKWIYETQQWLEDEYDIPPELSSQVQHPKFIKLLDDLRKTKESNRKLRSKAKVQSLAKEPTAPVKGNRPSGRLDEQQAVDAIAKLLGA